MLEGLCGHGSYVQAQAGAAGAITQQSTATPTSPEGGVDVPTLETPEASGTSEAAVPGVTGDLARHTVLQHPTVTQQVAVEMVMR